MLVHILRKHRELVNNWILHQDNMPLHMAHYVTEFLDEPMEHPRYSLDLAPCNFWLFLALKKALRG